MGGGMEAQEGGDTYIIMTNSSCMAETNTSLQSSYSPIKKQSYLKKKETLIQTGNMETLQAREYEWTKQNVKKKSWIKKDGKKKQRVLWKREHIKRFIFYEK